MIRRPPRSTQSRSSAASDVYKRQEVNRVNFDVNKLMREPYYTHEKEELNDLLIEMRNNEPGMCIVLDEYGQAEGLITLEDIVEEIIGDIHDEFDQAEELAVRQIGEHEYIVEGSINLDDFNDELGTNIDSEDYESLGGLIICLLYTSDAADDLLCVDIGGRRIIKKKKKKQK